jgi:hypothetical protein
VRARMHTALVSIKLDWPRREPWTLHVDVGVDECRDRLDAATSTRGHSYYLTPSHPGKPAPILRGVNKPRYPVQVARWESTLGRDSFVAWLCARVVPDEGGGTVVSGWVGVDPRFPLGQWLFLSVGALVVACFVVLGTWLAFMGQPSALFLAAGGLAWAAIVASMYTFGARRCRQEGARLRKDVQTVLSGPSVRSA